MLKYKIIFFVLTISIFVFQFLSALKAQTSSQEVSKHIKGIQATVIGKLNFQEGHGYFIEAKQSRYKWETKVWLRMSENGILIRKLQNLLNKTVKSEGELGQLPENVTASTPHLGIYLQDFEIEMVTDDD